MASYTSDEFRYNRPDKGPKTANDLTLVYSEQVEVQGVDGRAPGDPKAEYTLEGDGSKHIKISDIEKSNDQTLKIRVKGAGRNAPQVKQAYWTLDGKRIPKALSQLAATPLDRELDPAEVALGALEPLQVEIRGLADCVAQMKHSKA